MPFLAGGPTAADPLRVAATYRGVFGGRLPFSGDAGGTLWPGTTDGLIFENNTIRDTRQGDSQTQKVGVLIESKVGTVQLERNQIEAQTPVQDRRGEQQ